MRYRYLLTARRLYTAVQKLTDVVLPSASNENAFNGWILTAATVSVVAGWSLNQQFHAEVVPLTEGAEMESRDGWFSFLSLETRRKMFFKYEKRIRTLSTPEKVFEYFSSIEQDGVKYMTPADLLKALVPVYPPETSTVERGGALIGENTPKNEFTAFFSVFDMDGDDLISFHEYLTVLTLLSIPLKHIEIIFHIVDINDNGVIDKGEFETVLSHLKKQSRQVNLSRDGKRTGFKGGEKSEISGLLVKFFGQDGNAKLKLPEFKSFLEDLQNKLLVLEFLHYDFLNQNVIGSKDFARSIIGGIDLASIDSYLSKVDKMDETMAGYEINCDAFIAYHSLPNHYNEIEAALKFIESTTDVVSKQLFSKSIMKLTEIQLQRTVLEIIFYLFGDQNGNLKTKEFLKVLRSRVRN